LDNLVIFDGVCNFCTKFVQFVLRHESDHVLLFAPMQSTTGSRIMRELGIDPSDTETFVVISGGEAFTRSDAAIRLTGHLRGGWNVLRIFAVLPRPVRDWAYGVVARNRYRWFGRYDQCMVPSAAIRDRFITD
jgi:predicted DCC family thiol-disulfide oxidoreductase YuxK